MEEDYSDSRSRLLYIIRLSGLNSKDFAAKVNVSPSTISQITSTSDRARRTELSEMVARKIISAFPQFNISIDWLLSGDGPVSAIKSPPSLFDMDSGEERRGGIAKNGDMPITDEDRLATNEPLQNDIVGNGRPNDIKRAASDYAGPDTYETDDIGYHNASSKFQGKSTSSSVHEGMPDFSNGGYGSTEPSQPSSVQPNPKHIERVMIFYSDGTFDDYVPRKNM